MNVIVRLKYELAYYDPAIHRFNHYTTRITPNWFVLCFFDSDCFKIGVNIDFSINIETPLRGSMSIFLIVCIYPTPMRKQDVKLGKSFKWS